MGDRLQIAPRHRRILEALLREHLPGVEVWAYGSRVDGRGHDGSDLDLVLRTPDLKKLPAGRLSDFEDAIRGSNIPFLVEIHDWARLPERFHGEIERDYVAVSDSAARAPELRHGTATAPHWERRDVRDLIRDGVLVVGDGYRAKNSELSGSGLPFARAGNIADGFRFSDADRFPEDGLPRVGDKTSRPGDVVFTSKGTVGRFAFVRRNTERFVYSPQLCFWRSRDGKAIDPYFLYCWMRGPEFFGQFKGVAGQTDMAEYVSLTDQRRMFVTLPPLDEQRAIAHILGTLDDKIELNRRMNATLEAMARALFRSWFVDFDPVRAKLAGRDTGLPKEIADLFSDRLVDSELGNIPDGWETGPLAEHFEAVKGVSYKGSGLGHDGTPLHNLNSVHEGGGYKYEGIKFYAGDHAERHVARPGDVIVANTEQGHERLLIGFAAIVPNIYGDRGICSHHLYRLRSRDTGRLSAAFLQLLLNSPRMHDLVSGYANGTTVNMLPMDAMRKPLVLVPPRALIEAFDGLALEIEHRCEHTVRESRTLGVIRDALLPKLVSGELRVTGLDPTSVPDRSAPVGTHGA